MNLLFLVDPRIEEELHGGVVAVAGDEEEDSSETGLFIMVCTLG